MQGNLFDASGLWDFTVIITFVVVTALLAASVDFDVPVSCVVVGIYIVFATVVVDVVIFVFVNVAFVVINVTGFFVASIVIDFFVAIVVAGVIFVNNLLSSFEVGPIRCQFFQYIIYVEAFRSCCFFSRNFS